MKTRPIASSSSPSVTVEVVDCCGIILFINQIAVFPVAMIVAYTFGGGRDVFKAGIFFRSEVLKRIGC